MECKLQQGWEESDRSAAGRTVGVALPTGAASEAIERALLAALDDLEPRIGLKGSQDDLSCDDPRVCDMAALVLSRRWPQRHRFSGSAAVEERDNQIAAVRRAFTSSR
jgi:hypothetical protein